MEQQPSEVTFRGQLGRDRSESFNLPFGVANCAAPPVSKRRLRSGPNLHSGEMHHCLAGLFARDKHLVHDFAKACSLVLFLARPRAGTAGVETCKERLGSDGPVGVVVGLGPVGHLLACWSVPLARIAIDTIHASQRVWHASEFTTSATRRNPGLS